MSTAVEAPQLPWAPEAEQSLLGSLLQDSDALLAIAGKKMLPADLYDHRHRIIFSAIAEMSALRLPVDAVTVFEYLRDRKQEDDAGGLKYLNALANCVPSASNVGRYADLVIDKAQRRAVLAALDKAGDIVRGPDPSGDAMDRVEALIYGLRSNRTGSTLKHAGEIFMERTSHWERLQDGTTAPGIPTGLSVLDSVLNGGLHAGHVVNIGARPSVGKTSLALQIATHVSAAGHPALVVSAEMPAAELIDRAAANLAGVPMESIKTGRLDDQNWHDIGDVADQVLKAPLYIEDKAGITIMDVRAAARRVAQKHGRLALIVVDYLQLVQAVGNFNTRHHAIEQISRSMKVLAKELGTTLILLSQLTRASAQEEPELHHLKESGAIEEDADAVLLLHPLGPAPEGGMLILCKVSKNRHGRRGRFGLAFDPRLQRWQSSTGNVERQQGVR